FQYDQRGSASLTQRGGEATALPPGTRMMLMNIPPLCCPACGAIDTPTVGPGVGKHVARAVCQHCSRFIKWLPRALVHIDKEVHAMDCTNVCLISGYLERDPAL